MYLKSPRRRREKFLTPVRNIKLAGNQARNRFWATGRRILDFVALYVSTQKPRTRLRARILGIVALYVFPQQICSRLRRGDFRSTKIVLLALFYIICFRASGEAILGTLKYFNLSFLSKIVSRLRRGDFRYTKIC